MRTSKICQYLVAPISIALFFLGMLLTTVQAQQGTSGAAVQPDAPSDISGRVTNNAGEPVEAIDVFLEQREGTYWRSLRKTDTNTDGRFRFAILGSGIYRVNFRDPSSLYLATSFEDGAEIVLAGTSVDTIDVTLVKATVISGTLSGNHNRNWSSATVTAYRYEGDEWHREQWLDLPRDVYSATYEFVDLAAGQYAICADAYYYNGLAVSSSDEALAEEMAVPRSTQIDSEGSANLASVLIGKCYQNSGTGLDDATVLQLLKEGFIHNVDIVLGTGTETGHITGIVTNQQGEALDDIFVKLLPVSSLSPVGAHTNAQGQFSLQVREAATYTLSFYDATLTYATAYLGDTIWLDAAERHFISPTMPLHDLDVNLHLGGQITGSVTISNETPLLAGEVVAQLYVNDMWRSVAHAAIDGNGNFALQGLPAGTYRLWIEVSIDRDTSYAEYYDGGETDGVSGIVLAEGETISDMRVNLAASNYDGVIGGRVTANGEPLSGIRVEFDRMMGDGYSPFLYSYTDTDGYYKLEGLSNQFGYCIRFVDPKLRYATVFYGDNPQGMFCERVKIPDDNLSLNNDIALVEGGGISGTVQVASGQVEDDMEVIVYRRDLAHESPSGGIFVSHAETLISTEPDQNGHYLITGLLPGEYQIQFRYGYKSLYYGLTNDLLLATDIPVQAGQITQDIDHIWGLTKKTYLPMVLGE
ncbi:MAG: carboxypeptidase regulatory-like domain-containing protein [Caldilineaceae bacterium]